MKALLIPALLCTSLAAQSTVAHVNDSTSPGAAKDNKLSLDEAIRLVNLQLPLSALSAAERAQIKGAGAPTEIELDPKVTPTITLAGDLTPLDGPAAHIDVHLESHGGMTVIDASGRSVGLHVRTNHAHVHGLHIRGGKIGLVGDTTKHQHMGERADFRGLKFSGQTEVGLRLQASGQSKMTPVMLMMTSFSALPTAIQVDDRTIGGQVMLMGMHLSFDAVELGFDVSIGAMGSTTMCRIFRAKMRNSTQLLRERRTSTSTQRAMLMFIGGDFETTGDMVDVQGNTRVESAWHFHHSKFKPAKGKKAFRMWPQEGRFDFHGSENVVHGDIELTAGRLNRRIWAWNNIFRDGTFTISDEGARPSLRWNRFENYTFRATSGNLARIDMTSSEFVNSKLEGQSQRGNIVLDNCWLEATTTVGQVSTRNPAPKPWLSEATTSTETPKLGGSFDLTLDMPPGILGIWHFGFADPNLSLTEEPWRFYADRTKLFAVPGTFILRSTVRIQIPNDPSIAGQQLYAMPATLPFQGQTHVPAFMLPAGVYITPQK